MEKQDCHDLLNPQMALTHLGLSHRRSPDEDSLFLEIPPAARDKFLHKLEMIRNKIRGSSTSKNRLQSLTDPPTSPPQQNMEPSPANNE